VPIASLTSSVTSAIGNHGLYAVFGLMMVDAVFPAASELVMLYAGALASGAFAGQHVVLFGWTVPYGFQAYVVMALAGTIGYTIGGLIGWSVGFYAGRPYLERHGRWLHLNAERLDRADRWFERHGSLAVLIGRITPLVRSFISIPAGVARMPLGTYTLWTVIGSAIWCFAFAGVGWGLGASYEHFNKDFKYVEYAVALAVVAAVVWLVIRWRRSRTTTIEGDASDPAR
jgi:membrane protein DedA with SNARE-associated domain